MSMDIGQLTGEIAIEDQFSSTFEMIIHAAEKFGEDFEGSLGAIAAGVGIASVAVLGMTAAVTALGNKGSEILGVENAFDSLAAKAGTTGEALRAGLSAGVQETIGQYELMTATSKLLGSGMQLNEEQARLMGSAARELGKATGGDATQGLEMLSGALVTGRVRGLQQQIGVINLTDGEDKYARSLGLTRDQLDERGKLEGKRIAILGAVQEYVDRLGTSELSFKEKIEQSKASVVTWVDELGKSVATSSDVGKALDTVTTGLKSVNAGAFLMGSAVGVINFFASGVTAIGSAAIVAAQGIGTLIDKVNPWSTSAKDAAAAERQAGVDASNLAILNFKLGTSFTDINQASAEWTKRAKEAKPAIDANAQAVETSRIVTEAYQKSVDAVLDGVKKSAREINVQRDAYKTLGDSILFTTSGQKSFLDAMNQIIESGRSLTKEESTRYELIVKNQLAENHRGMELLRTKGITLDMIVAAKALGVTEQELAEKWGTTTKAIQGYEAEAQKVLDLDRKAEDAHIAVSGTATDKAIADHKREFDDYVRGLDTMSSQYGQMYDKAAHIRQDEDKATLMGIGDTRAARQKAADDALSDLMKLQSSGLANADDIDVQRQKYWQLRDAINGNGSAVAQATAIQTDWGKTAIATIDAAYDAQVKLNEAMSYSITYDLTKQSDVEKFRRLNPKSAFNSYSDQEIIEFAKGGGTLEDLLNGGYKGHASAPSTAAIPSIGTTTPIGSRTSGAGFGGTIVQAPITVSGVMDTRTQNELSDTVKAKVMASLSTRTAQRWG